MLAALFSEMGRLREGLRCYGPRGEVEGPAGRLELPCKLEKVLYAGGLGEAIRELAVLAP